MAYTLHLGDCLEVMRTMPDASIDSVVSDPPYGLSFMGKDWDHGVPGVPFWAEALRVAKPGAMLLAFGGTRTYHRLTCAIEDAGWEIRDCIMWVYGSGFPKSHDISKAIDKAAGAEREVVGTVKKKPSASSDCHPGWVRPWAEGKTTMQITAPATPEAEQWDGWGTALKPAYEKIIVARKPLNKCSERDIIVGNLLKMEAQLWLLLHALTAGKSSTLSPSEYGEALSIAQWNADALTSTLEDLCDQMDTLPLEWAIHTSLSTVSSWLSTWEEASKHGSTFITETATSPIIDLKTLSCSASALTPHTIIQDVMTQHGLLSNAQPAVKVLSVAAKSMSATLERFAVESAIEKGHILRPDAIDKAVLEQPVIVAMKPLDGTFANNALVHGVAGLNVDGCRVGTGTIKVNGWKCGGEQVYNGRQYDGFDGGSHQGRWPANVIHDGSDEVVGLFPMSKDGVAVRQNKGEGTAARFFYCAKASRSERTHNGRVDNRHPTVKPLELMRYLCRLTKTPTGGTVLDPFMGSGTTGVAAILEGRDFVGIEQDEANYHTAKERIGLTVADVTFDTLPLLREAAD